jgi:transcriptional regulator of acetoin/glycerol metabolism
VTKNGTVSLIEDDEPRKRDPEASLILVFDAAAPLDPPLSVSLNGIDELVVGRGPARGLSTIARDQLRLDLADAATSASHARLVRVKREWTVVDENSKNGTLVNGRRVASSDLGPEDLIEVGNTFFVLRQGAVDLGPERPQAERRSLRTFNGALAQSFQLLGKVARSKVPVLILGETGTGKELAARATHELSGRTGPFIAVNCGAIPDTLVESELFGARKGAFSEAHTDRIGTVVAADKGTLLLDEIAELPESSQAALLRVLQDGEVMALGATRPVRVDVRIVAATHQNLAERVAAKRFRNDLYARLRGHVMTLPPLRTRREDLGLLIADLLPRAAGARAASIVFQRAAARALLSYPWPHNIRELEHVLSRAAALLDGNEIRLAHLPDELAAPRGARRPDDTGEVKLVQLLRESDGNLSHVARTLGTSRSQVQRLVQRYGIDMSAYRSVNDSDSSSAPVVKNSGGPALPSQVVAEPLGNVEDRKEDN